MIKMQKKGPAACALALALSFGTAAAATPETCSSDAFAIDGSQVAVQTCAAGPAAKAPATPKPGSASIVQTFSSHGASFSQTTSVEYLPGSEVSRTIADVSLAPLGIAKTLHMTIAYKPGSAKVERALLVPGAIVLK
jgi:hypothetical protein